MTTARSGPDIVDQLANCRAFWLGFDNDDATESNEVTWYRSGVSSPMYNGVLRVHDGTDVRSAVRQATRRFAGLPWVWWVGPDSPAGTVDQLRSAAAVHRATNVVMAVRLDRITASVASPTLTITRSSGDQGMAAWVAAYAPNMGVDSGAMPALVEAYRRRADPPGAFVRFEARDGEQIVGTSALLDQEGVAGVYVVATTEGYRRRGIATVLTAAALQEGRRRGLSIGTLQATAAGAHVYRRMGFRPVAEYQLFTLASVE